MNILLSENFSGFYDFIFENVDLDLYKYKYLRNYLEKIVNQEYRSKESSIINVTDSGWLLLLHGDVTYVYGENWKREQIVEIFYTFQFDYETTVILTGDTNIIEEIVQYLQLNNSLIKRRIFYEARAVKEVSIYNILIRPAVIDDLDELAKMFQDYHEDEYNGNNNKSFEAMQILTHRYIQSNDLFILLDGNGVITSLCSILDPDIGILFTKRDYRGRGYAKCLLSFCSNLLLERNTKVFLMTDQDVLESNRVCSALGFEPIFYYKSIQINT